MPTNPYQFGPGGNEVPQYDGLGSMRQGVDPSTGNVISGADYDAFGNCLTSGSSTVSAYQWQAQSGYRNDGDIGGLIKVGYRYYDPQTGRFTSRDTEVGPHAVNSPVEAMGFQTLAAVQAKISPQEEVPSFAQTSIGTFSLQPVQGHNIMDGEHSQNAYGYCLGDPMNFGDPSGHIQVLGVLLILVIGAAVLYVAYRVGKAYADKIIKPTMRM